MAGMQMVSGQGVKLTARCVTGDSYAASLAPHNITLSYDANGGINAPAAQTEEVTGRNYTFTITDAEPTRYHYDFRAWVEESNKDKYVGVNYIYDDEKGDVQKVIQLDEIKNENDLQKLKTNIRLS